MRWMLAGVLVLAGCSGTPPRPDQLDISHEESVDVGGGPNLMPLAPDAFNTPGAGSGLTQELTTSLGDQGVEENEVKSVKLTRLALEITAPIRDGVPAQDLRFLDLLVMRFSSPGKDPVVVAESLPPLTGTQSASFGRDVFSVEIPVKDVELKDYVTADSMDVTTVVTANGRPAFSCTVKITTTLHVELDPVGAAQNNNPLAR